MMIRDPSDKSFEELRRILALKQYERPPAEFRGEFMHEFRRRRRQEDQARQGWIWRFWTWLAPDMAGVTRLAAASAVVALLATNVFVSVRHQRLISSPNAATLAQLTQSPVVTASTSKTSDNDWTVNADELDNAQTDLLLDDFYRQAESIMNSDFPSGSAAVASNEAQASETHPEDSSPAEPDHSPSPILPVSETVEM